MELKELRMDLIFILNEEKFCKIENFEEFVNLNVEEMVIKILELFNVIDFFES